MRMLYTLTPLLYHNLASCIEITLSFGPLLSVQAWLRVATGLHTPLQVVVGGMLGSSTALLWRFLWERHVFPALASETTRRVAAANDNKLVLLEDVVWSYDGPYHVLLWGACFASILMFGSQVAMKWSRKVPSPRPSQEEVDNNKK